MSIVQFPSEGFLFLLVDIALCFLALLNFAVKACVNLCSVLMHRFELLSTNRAAIGIASNSQQDCYSKSIKWWQNNPVYFYCFAYVFTSQARPPLSKQLLSLVACKSRTADCHMQLTRY